MKLAVEFPSVSYREGPEGIIRLAREVERIGFDQLDMFDHVVMGYPTETRPAPMYPPQMPIMEAVVMLSFIAAVTSTIGLGTEVLVLPQRNPTLTAKQIATLDTLSGGRVRLGVGVGWQESEYEALGESFRTRGKRMDEAIRLLRKFWGEERVDSNSSDYRFEAIAMEPKPPQGAKLPIWVGGSSRRALLRVAELGDGWMASSGMSEESVSAKRALILEHAIKCNRDPAEIGFQMMLDSPPRDDAGKAFYSDMDKVVAAAARIQDLEFGWATINMTAIFQSGARTIDSMTDVLGNIHDRIRSEFD